MEAEAIQQALEQLESQLAAIGDKLERLQAQRSSLIARQLELKRELHATAVATTSRFSTTAHKLELYRQYFRGNDSVYAYRWEFELKASIRKAGYSFACANRNKPGICPKLGDRKFSCARCEHPSFQPLTDDVLLSHLRGQQTIGLYPMRRDNTASILAFDFDDADHLDAARALLSTCHDYRLDCLLERSRSGNGSHVWLFFAEDDIPAYKIRQLGTRLLHQVNERYPQLSLESYDRLFPTQDALTGRGLGNLICLPLQGESVKQGNCCFIDPISAQPVDDFWQALASIKPISNAQLEETLTVLPESLPEAEAETGSELKPWQAPDTGPVPNCPQQVSLDLGGEIYLPLNALPSPLIARLKRLATFGNPEWYQRIARRFSTQGTPRFVSAASIEKGYLHMPVGLRDEVAALLQNHGVKVQYEDHRKYAPSLALSFNGTLRPDQQAACRALLQSDTGLLQAHTAFGKTVTAIGLISERNVPTLILVHSKELLSQWRKRLASFLEGCETGFLGGGKDKLSGQVDVVTWQSLGRGDQLTLDPRLLTYGQVIVDEAHRLASPKYEALLKRLPARYKIGLTATPKRRDGLQKLVLFQVGPIRFTAKHKPSNLTRALVLHELALPLPAGWEGDAERPHIAKIYQHLAQDLMRNQRIVTDALSATDHQKQVLVLTERTEHVECLARLLEQASPALNVIGLHGKLKPKLRKKLWSKIQEPPPAPQVIVATERMMGEAIDLPYLDTLLLALPLSWRGRLEQCTGRLERPFEGKHQIQVIDYLDSRLPEARSMWKKRQAGYARLGFKQITQAEQQTSLFN